MAEILHGRRKGSSSGKTKGPDMKSKNNGINLDIKNKMPNADLQNVCILTQSDMDRLYNQLNKKRNEEERLRVNREEREKLKEKSRQQVAQWDNTLLGLRQKKLETRRMREEQLEDERKAMDIEEEMYQSSRRKDIIEKAKTQQYYQTDRVKNFHGALLLTEVLKERDAQIELKSLKQKAANGADDEWVKYTRKQLEDSILKEQEEARQRITKNFEYSKDVKKQIDRHKKIADEEKFKAVEEGEELRKLAGHFDLEKKHLEEIKWGESKQLMKDNIVQRKEKQRLQAIRDMQEEEEDEECRIFAAAKRKMMKMRTVKEKEIFTKKQNDLDKIREKLYAQMQEATQDENTRLEKAEFEEEEKRIKQERAKQEKRMKAYEESKQHMMSTIKRNELLKEENAIAELKRLQVQKETDDIFLQAELDKRMKRLNNEKDRKSYNLKQNERRRLLETEGMKKELEMEKKNKDLLDMEEVQFNEYAKKVIDHCKSNGRNVYPLKKAAGISVGGGVKPNAAGKGQTKQNYLTADTSCHIMPNYQGDSTEEIKETITNNEGTDKRLGFVW